MSRELDAKVAELVMGYELIKIRDIYVEGAWNGDNPDSLIELPHQEKLPHYSTDIAAAWKVVEKFSFDLKDWNGCGEEDYRGYTCKLYDGRTQVEETADTAPLAICLAALKAVEK